MKIQFKDAVRLEYCLHPAIIGPSSIHIESSLEDIRQKLNSVQDQKDKNSDPEDDLRNICLVM